MFNEYMMEDAVYLLLAGGLIACAILAYTRSVFLTLTTLTSILYTLSLAYFFYTFVCGIAFFPFMNVLATVIAIGWYKSTQIIFHLGRSVMYIISFHQWYQSLSKKWIQNLSLDKITFQGMKQGILRNGIFTYVGHEILVLKSYKLYKMFMTLEAIYLQFDRKTHLLL